MNTDANTVISNRRGSSVIRENHGVDAKHYYIHWPHNRHHQYRIYVAADSEVLQWCERQAERCKSKEDETFESVSSEKALRKVFSDPLGQLYADKDLTDPGVASELIEAWASASRTKVSEVSQVEQWLWQDELDCGWRKGQPQQLEVVA